MFFKHHFGEKGQSKELTGRSAKEDIDAHRECKKGTCPTFEEETFF